MSDRFELVNGIITDMQDNERMYGIFELVDKLNEQQATIDQLNLAIDDLLSHTSCDEIKKENEELRQKIKHCVYVDVDNENGCMNCKYDIGSICSILNCGTHDYLEGVSECSLKYWECKEDSFKTEDEVCYRMR